MSSMKPDTTRRTKETSIEKYLVECVENMGGVGIKLSPISGLRGIPDRLIILPGPRVIFVEVKRPSGGVISAHQSWWRKKLTALGCEHAFVKTRGEVEALLRITP